MGAKEIINNASSKNFALGDILAVMTGSLMPPNRMDGVYSVINYMVGKSLSLSELPRYADRCKDDLTKQFPQLKNITGGEVSSDKVHAWYAEQCARYGERLSVAPLSANEASGPSKTIRPTSPKLNS